MDAIAFAAWTIAAGWAVRIPTHARRKEWARAGLLLAASLALLAVPLRFIIRDLLAAD